MSAKPSAILLFIHKEADNEYSPFETLDKAADRITEYSKANNDTEKLMIYIDHELPQEEKDKFWEKVQAYGVKSVYRITPAVLYNAL